MTETPLVRRELEASELMRDFPPRFVHPGKKLVYRLACPSGALHSGRLVFSRWREMRLPETVGASRTSLELREGPFDYEHRELPAVSWHLNFADRDLFCAYGGRLLAQDELQVLEHPALGALREMLVATGERPLTVEDGRPTPVLVTGVERRCALATANLYGNRFAAASPDEIVSATRALSRPTLTNVVAMEAPSGGRGIYRRSEIELVLATAFTGFSAAKIESSRLASAPIVEVHTGFWGCGAYGGNRVLMSILQILAARLAGVDRLVFHAFDRTGPSSLEQARATIEPLAVDGARVTEVVRAIDALELAWGVSDGT